MSFYTSEFSAIIRSSSERLKNDLYAYAPFLASHAQVWTEELAGTTETDAYFKHPYAFPFLLIPYLIERNLCNQQVDAKFQEDLVYSSISAYYYTRMLDNLMDGDKPVPKAVLPASAFFHTRFQLLYHGYFEAQHPFWSVFNRVWFRQAEVAAHDIELKSIDETAFTTITSQKICGAKIPAAAVCYRYGQPDLIPSWSRVIEVFGCWHMMFQDFLDWNKDLKHGNMTYFISEGMAQKQPDEVLAAWVFREGIDWAMSKLEVWMSELTTIAQQLQSDNLLNYLNARHNQLLEQRQKMSAGLKLMQQLSQLEWRRDHSD